MHEGRLPVEQVSDVPIVAAPEEIDLTNAAELRLARLEKIPRCTEGER
jgi:hypothetical protein